MEAGKRGLMELRIDFVGYLNEQGVKGERDGLVFLLSNPSIIQTKHFGQDPKVLECAQNNYRYDHSATCMRLMV